MRGLSDAYGSWKTICMSRAQRAQLRAARACVISLPVERDAARRWARAAAGPRGRWWTCRSPTRPPGRASRRGHGRSSTPSTARTSPTCARSTPAVIGKCLTSPLDLEQRGRRSGGASAQRRPVIGARRHVGCARTSPAGRVRVQHAATCRRDRLAERRSRRNRPSQTLGGELAARMEAAAGRQAIRIGGSARDRTQPLAPRSSSRGSEPSRPRCRGAAGSSKISSRGACSTIRPAYITSDAVGDLGDHAQVVGDQHDRRCRTRVCRSRQQLQDLRLDGDVERGGRLVGDEQRGSQASAIAIIRAGACRRRTGAGSRRPGVPAAGIRTAAEQVERPGARLLLRLAVVRG